VFRVGCFAVNPLVIAARYGWRVMARAAPSRRILFLHPQGPGQFVHLAPHLAARHDVAFLSRAPMAPLPGVRASHYRPHRARGAGTHRYAAWTEAAVLAGQAALRACLRLKAENFVPDLCIAHPGWGDALFLRDAFPEARILAHCEYFWRGAGADVGFADDVATDLDAQCALRMRNAPLLVSLEAADRLSAPTRWQRDLHPDWLRPKIEVIHDGIDTFRTRPDPGAAFTTPSGLRLTPADEVVTYVARGLEPQRGFPQLMRALPALLRRCPDAHVVICGADTPSYGRAPRAAPSWRAKLLDEVGPLPPRVHLVGQLPYADYLALLQVSALHLYLSVPFVLSWSVTEAMAAGCLVLGSDTDPVREFITDGANGFLVEMRDPAAVADRAATLLGQRSVLDGVRAAARETIVQRCALKDCLAAQDALIEAMLATG
jgi:glycosyltransferase involved in cell wall biosynthesis